MSEIDNMKSAVKPFILVGYLVAAGLSGAGGSYAWLKQNGQEVVRPDPFTGTQAIKLEEQIAGVEDIITHHLLTHPDRSLELRIQRLEDQYKTIVDNQNRILRKLEEGG